MIICNWLGLGMLVGSTAFGYLVEGIVAPLGKPQTLAVTLGFVTASVVDVVYRWKNETYQTRKGGRNRNAER